MARTLAKVDTSTVVLEAAKKVLRQKGYAKLSTRDVAAAAGVPLSQIHYHFGSKQGNAACAIRVFEFATARSPERAIPRQNAQIIGTVGQGLRLPR
ncbi:TetR family transcriptional regulator [Bradyrhizobium liaoningense]